MNNTSILPPQKKPGLEPDNTQPKKGKNIDKRSSFDATALSAVALLLPGLLHSTAYAADDNEADFQYSHYQEGKRDVNIEGIYGPAAGTNPVMGQAPNYRQPIEVDSIHGSGSIGLTDRIKLAFNYFEDTWSGATPLASTPSSTFRILEHVDTANGVPIPIAGATPFPIYKDSSGNILNGDTRHHRLLPGNAHTVNVMSYASPETRHQGDFKLGYEWNEAAATIGGGISTEPDYESRFVNLGGRMDFNQKQTTANLGLSYTNSSVGAIQVFEGGGYKSMGTRQDWAPHLSLTQVLNKDALVELGMGYTRSSGYMSNPYKLSVFYYNEPLNYPGYAYDRQFLPVGVDVFNGRGYSEHRPELRNQFNWNTRFVQYVEPLDAALHFDYQFSHDDWGINAHTFSADWAQPLGAGWTVTPRARYYSQDAANFYQAYFFTNGVYDPKSKLGLFPGSFPTNFSSDQRLSGYGVASGGLMLSKQFSKGVSLETGFEYFKHQGSLKLGGGGEGSFADYDYWMANASLKVNLSALGQGISGGSDQHVLHNHQTGIPAGVMFGHTLDKAGDMMVGYRYMRDQQGGNLLHGSQTVNDTQILSNGCPETDGCTMLPSNMTTNMHMLELMIAPTDWLTLMLMPQFMDMNMSMRSMPATTTDSMGMSMGSTMAGTGDSTGGIGDTGLYTMVTLFNSPQHHVHATVGGTAPSGAVDLRLKTDHKSNLDDGYTHYGMQLGSGTWDFKPSLTYTGKDQDWSWGGQLSGTKRLQNKNPSGYALGDMFGSSVWGGYNLTHWLNTSIRAAYTWQGSISGQYPGDNRDPKASDFTCNKADYTSPDTWDDLGNPGPNVFHVADYNACSADAASSYRQEKARIDALIRPSPMDSPKNYGGHYLDIGFGLNVNIPNGAFAGHNLKFEWLQPVYTNVNGYQLDRSGALTFTWGVGF